MVWIPITIAAASLQVARNALQRGLLETAGPWGATLVRFLFGLPFAVLFLSIAWMVTPHPHLHAAPGFVFWSGIGGFCQLAATAALLISMQRTGFAMGTVFAQSGIPFTAVFALGFGEVAHALQWLGLGLTTLGVVLLGWPRAGEGARSPSGAFLGILAGAGFALSSNAFRQAALIAAPGQALIGAQATLVCAQALQAGGLTLWLAARDPAALGVVVRAWRPSLGAGFLGAAASGLWFTAFALSPVGPVRAVGVVETPVAALAGRRMFKEPMSARQALLAGLTAAGVALAALG